MWDLSGDWDDDKDDFPLLRTRNRRIDEGGRSGNQTREYLIAEKAKTDAENLLKGREEET